MSNTQTDLDDTDDSDVDLPEGARQRMRQLQKDNKRLAAFEHENAQLRQHEAIRTAGLELNETQIKALTATHEGESTPELLRKTAETLGFAQPLPDVDPSDQKAHEQLASARSGASNIADISYEQEVATARNAEELKAVALKHNRPWAT